MGPKPNPSSKRISNHNIIHRVKEVVAESLLSLTSNCQFVLFPLSITWSVRSWCWRITAINVYLDPKHLQDLYVKTAMIVCHRVYTSHPIGYTYLPNKMRKHTPYQNKIWNFSLHLGNNHGPIGEIHSSVRNEYF